MPRKCISAPAASQRPPPRVREVADPVYHKSIEDLLKSASRYLPNLWNLQNRNQCIMIYKTSTDLGIFPEIMLKINASMHVQAGYYGWFTDSGHALKSIDVKRMTICEMITAVSGFSACEGISHEYKVSDKATLHQRIVSHYTDDCSVAPRPPTLELIAVR